ncbi:hypothetical protein OG478_02570 [Streptomyces phaeochromogenes]|uniref:hypothetical protein n=1 Tax=Streptomyces phaeochromogenes TaxID=1923 RepID=UPI00386728F4|nr:hypothetical protein OG478_02570 [Streptomyces phaeochromogenes]
MSVALIAAPAVVAGARSCTAIGQWAAAAPRPPWRGWVAARKTIYAIIDLPSTQASPQQLGELARPHWGVENRQHFVRGTTSAEDVGGDHRQASACPDVHFQM